MPLRMQHMPIPSLRALMSLNVYPNKAAQLVHWSRAAQSVPASRPLSEQY